MPQLPEPTDGTSVAQNPSSEAEIGSTTDTGAPAPSDRNSLTVGADGPIVLHDVHFLNQMAHFNRERIPERNVHAKGSGAFGARGADCGPRGGRTGCQWAAPIEPV